jgi:uncharacterized protein with LGFP repeats
MRLLLAMLIVGLGEANAGFATAGTPEEPAACGHRLSAPVLAKWNVLGGEQGYLGCPIADEGATVPSPTGATGRELDFPAGAIIWHGSGPRAGQTFVLSGCAYRRYFQFGGAGGWLGLPIADEANTPDGQRQYFEGGRVTYLRSTGDCDAEHTEEFTAAAAPNPSPVGSSVLDIFYEPVGGDHITAAGAGTVWTAMGAHYQRERTEARVLTEAVPGTSPLKLYWNEAKGDHLTVGTDGGEREALAEGYGFEASQGFVWTDPHPDTTPLRQFRDPASGHHLLVGSAAGEAEAKARGFVFVRIEGYAPKAP